MSDIPPSLSNLQWKLGFERPSLAYANKLCKEEIIFAVSISFPVLKAWHDHVVTWKCSNSYSFVDLLEFSIPGQAFAITSDEIVRSNVNESLRKLASQVNAEYKGCKGRKKKALELRVKKFHLLKGQTVPVADIKIQNQAISDELEHWKSTCENLESKVRELHDEMEQALKEKSEVISDLHSKNEELSKYIKKLESTKYEHKGKDISETKNKFRTLKSFMSRAEVALWFAKSFGLKVENITVSELKTGKVHNLKYEKKENSTNAYGFNSLSEMDKLKVENILFLLDKFCVGDNFYHEITILIDELPRSYLMKQRRDQLNKLCHLSSTPGEEEGAQLPFKEILTDRIRDYIGTHKDITSDGGCIKVKISGDGTRMTRNSNFILLSFALLQSSEDVMSAKGNHTIAVVNGKEDYSTLKRCFKDVFRDINQLVKEKEVDVDGKTVPLEFFLGGDYKFLLTILGLSGATSNYACAWCKVHKDDRWNMSYSVDYYTSPDLKRTVEEIHRLAKQSKAKQNYCCVDTPLLDIDLDHVVLDELHLLLRIMDVLLNNLVKDAMSWDQADNWGKKKSEQKDTHLQHLVSTIRSCGVFFSVWEKTNTDGKGTGVYDFTSLLGADKKKILNSLPEKFEGVLQPKSEKDVKLLWEKFSIIYAIVTCTAPSEEMIMGYFEKAQEWIKLFLTLREKAIGYKRANITPYMHAMVYHVPQFLNTYKTIKRFTGQGVEKNNDVARTTVLRKSNKWNSTEDVLKHESRLWELKDRERLKREYTKRNNNYWDFGLTEQRQNKRRRFDDA